MKIECPFCGGEVSHKAIICRWCKKRLESAPVQTEDDTLESGRGGGRRCSFCGESMPEETVVCDSCGRPYEPPAARFTEARLSRWWNLLSKTSDFSRLMSNMGSDVKSGIRSIPNAFLPGESSYGLLIPITNKDWALRDVNGIQQGALACFATRFVIYDFARNCAFSYSYDLLEYVQQKGSELRLGIHGQQPLRLRFKLHLGLQLAWSFVGLAANLIEPSYSTEKSLDETDASMDEKQAYLAKIRNFFQEAQDGIRSESNQI